MTALGAASKQASTVFMGYILKNDHPEYRSLSEGFAPLSNANNLSVIGIYPAKKSNRNQKNNAQKESIGLCKKRIDKMEMPTKSK